MNLSYVLYLADTALINGHRISEWCGHGPILEQDIALTNTALDHLGRARSLYQYAADVFNELPEEAKAGQFNSVAIQQAVSSTGRVDEDNLAYLRDVLEYRNLLLVEQPNGDWAQTIARSFYFDAFNVLYFTALQQSNNETLVAIAAKSLKEVTYHLRWSSEWVIRLGDGTEESHRRMQEAVDNMWMYTGEMFMPVSFEKEMAATAGMAPDVTSLKAAWLQQVKDVFDEATLEMPTETWMQQGGKEGRHSEHLGYILADLQFLQRAYPGMQW